MFVVGMAGCTRKETVPTERSVLTAAETADIQGKYTPPITVKVGLKDDASITYAGKESLTENSWFELYKSVGINLDVMYTTTDEQRGEKLAQTIIGGNYPDVFWVELKDYEDYVKQGILANVTSYYEQGYLSESSQNYLDSDNRRSVQNGTVDGKIYGIPQMGSSYDAVPILWIRKDWLTALGLSEPKTVEDFVAVASAFTKSDPDGNGRNDTYGFGLNGAEPTSQYSGIPYFFTMFGAIPNETAFIEKNGKIIWGGQLQENMEEGLAVLSALYQSGCIPADFTSADRVKVEADFTSGKTGMIIAPMWAVLGTYGNALALDINTEIIAVPIPTSKWSPDGAVYLPSGTLGFWCASAKSQNPEALFKIFNLSTYYIADVQNRTQEEMEKYCTGSFTYTGKALALINYLDNPNNNYDSWKNISKAVKTSDSNHLKADHLTHYENIQFFLQNKNEKSYVSLSEENKRRFNTGAGFYSVFGAADSGYGALDTMIRRGKWLPCAYTSAPTEAMVTHSANLMAFNAEMLAGIIVGHATPSSYGAFLEAWKERGGKEMLESVNKP
jgi:putative aldouronate transport system substrate-binding protein